MGCRWTTVVWVFLVMSSALLMTGGRTDGIDSSNPSSGGLLRSTAKLGSELLLQAHQEDSADDIIKDDFDGGFSSLDGMLQWAIGHSDPAKLKETAEAQQRLLPSELKERQIEIKESMEKMKMPSDADLMKIAISDLDNLSISLEDRYCALQELLELVEPIDNANDLSKLGGLFVVTKELNNSDPGIRTIAAWILGKASQNNPVVQQQILELGVLSKLVKMVKSNCAEEANKALYAISALIRSNLTSQELFYAEAGNLMLQDILRNTSVDIRLQKKAVLLLADLVEFQLVNVEGAELPFFSDKDLIKSLVDLTASTDLDLQEKALVAIKRLLQLRATETLVFKNFCALDAALNRMREFLLDLMDDEHQRDYVRDVESLRREVEYIFHKKLVTGVDSSIPGQ